MTYRNTAKHTETFAVVPASSGPKQAKHNVPPLKGGGLHNVSACGSVVPTRRPKRNTKQNDAAELVARLRLAEYTLIEAITKTDALTIKEAGKLVAMQRKLRAMRYQVEAKAGI